MLLKVTHNDAGDGDEIFQFLVIIMTLMVKKMVKKATMMTMMMMMMMATELMVCGRSEAATEATRARQVKDLPTGFCSSIPDISHSV